MRTKVATMRARALIICAVITVAACSGGGAPSSAPPLASSPPADASGSPAGGGPVDLSFITWDYGIDTILDNIGKFEDLNPSINVEHQGFSWFDYHDIVVQRSVANTPTDLLYSSDHWVQEWADAGWLEPLETRCPGFEAYVPEMAPYAAQAAQYNGHTYGLPYFAAPFVFIYNQEHLDKAGISAPPTTWEEVADQARKIKAAGVAEYPLVFTFSQADGASIEIFYSMVYSQAAEPGAMFDAEGNPTFNTAGGPASYVVDWIRNALLVDKTMDPASLQLGEIDTIAGLKSGSHTFTVDYSYGLAELNKEGSGPQAGKFQIVLMPGTSHVTNGIVRLYSMSSLLPSKGQDAIDGACKFIEYMGGKTDGEYKVVKRWAVENGLGFAQLPLFDDPDVAAAFDAVLDTEVLKKQSELSRVKEGLTPFFGAWDIFARAELQRAYLGEVSTQEALDNMATKWEELKP